jgi:DNA-binding transcriptional MerR regulator
MAKGPAVAPSEVSGIVPLITTGGAAKILGLGPAMVRLLDRQGKLPGVRTRDGLRLFLVEHVVALRAARAALALAAPAKGKRRR